MADHILWRNGVAYYYRRVPEEVRPFVDKTHVRISLKTRDEREARKKADAYSDYIESYWRDVVKLRGTNEEKYKAAVVAAKAHGFAYRHATSIQFTDGAMDQDIIGRLNVAYKNEAIAPAVLGGIEPPRIKLSAAIDRFIPLAQDLIAGKKGQQYNNWYNPRARALANLIEVIGDIDIPDLQRSHALQFHEYWMARMGQGVAANTANKDFLHIQQVLGRVCLSMQLDLDVRTIFKDLKFKENTLSRLPYETAHIRDVIVQGLDTMGDEARMIVYAMIDTGCRNKEIIGLLPEDIRLADDVPHILIRPNSVRGLKTVESERAIPLVGLSLLAFKTFPQGFAHYRGTNLDNASNAIGKYFAENGLNPTSRHSLYSLRHSFKDRLRAVDTPSEMINVLMGHVSHTPTYGSGYSLEAKRRWLEKIVF